MMKQCGGTGNLSLMYRLRSPSDIEQRVEELKKLGFNVSFEIVVSDSKRNARELVFKITKEKPKRKLT